jgi:hypothetical protein
VCSSETFAHISHITWFHDLGGAGSNTSTVALRVVGGDEKGSLESETVKYGPPRDSDPGMTALARANSNCKRQTRPLVRESAPCQQTRNSLTVVKSGRKPRMGALFQDRLAD